MSRFLYAHPVPYEYISELLVDGLLYEHHTSLFRGYVSRRLKDYEIIAYPYIGKFGVGYYADFPNRNSTRYSHRAYYIFR